MPLYADAEMRRPREPSEWKLFVEVGTHEDLMANGGQYAELYGIQPCDYR